MRPQRIFATLVSVTVVSLCATLAAADPALDAMAQKLTALRAEVESLSTQVEQSKETRRADRRSFAGQKADLEFQLQREERRAAQLNAQMDKRKTRIAELSAGSETLSPAVASSIAELRQRVEAGLPFKRAERLAQIDELEAKLAAGTLTPEKGAVHLWALVEDELRLARENGLYRQLINLDGDEFLVDVARVGMVTMYFRTDDGRSGWVQRDDLGWQWVPTNDERDQQQIALLFDAMRKQIRTGFFELPSASMNGGVR